MLITLKNLFFIIAFNSSIFLMLLVGIQNSSNKSRVDLLVTETVNLPISFIIGTSFISGSLIGGFLSVNLKKNKGK
tara:strand:+ start:2115 stop:2342 length:228 start_codon:yes stop_codon:yes gene_type:complete